MNPIQAQYRTSQNLGTRMSVHEKYSVNPQPFGDWIFSHYAIRPGDRILELGCGTGRMWRNHLPLPEGCRLTLTDFSPGMLESARRNLSSWENLEFQAADIQDIPWAADSFDMVIANMMLYHVPDLDRGLSEVRRVLKDGGTFYCATFGMRGVHQYVAELLEQWNVSGKIAESFTLQNGAESLSAHFASVTRLDRTDGLAITHLPDFADYIYSMASLTNVADVPREALLSALASRAEEGILYVPKEYGMFLCR